MSTSNNTKIAILERIPRWLASVALMIFVLLLVVSYITGKRISWSPLGFIDDTSTINTTLPKGAVIAFADAPDGETKKKCSDLGIEWAEFDAANGKFILGSGSQNGRIFTSGSFGGEYEVTLDLEQIPKHDHTYQRQKDMAGGCGLSGCGFHTEYPTFNTGTKGGDKDGNTVPHNNLPPYIVLTYCKRV